MSQTVRRSWKEAWANIAVGYIINYAANLLIQRKSKCASGWFLRLLNGFLLARVIDSFLLLVMGGLSGC